MTLATGARLGPYEIVAPAGAGGMGEVYRARDTRLDRTVAIKIVPDHLATDIELRQRLEREARAISALQHPYICTLFDVGNENGTDYLVMEYLEGETLAARLRKGALPVSQVVKIGAQIADALDRAHSSGLVHRDLKPGNIMLTRGGAKLMDFGLAKPTKAFAAAHSDAVTLTTPVTQRGTIVGTFQYMAPEQVEGKEADGRSDIFALGAVLYEMATGKPALDGKGAISVASAILEKEPPPITEHQPLAPPGLEHVVRRALAKAPEERWQSARDLKAELEWIAQSSSRSALPVTASRVPWKSARLGWALAAALLLVVAALVVVTRRSEPPPAVVRAVLLPPDGATLTSTLLFAGPVTVSPDGSRVVFAARQGEGKQVLWVRELREGTARPLAGTAGAARPFWSPDSRSIGFVADRRLKRVDVNGGPVFTLTQVGDARGGSWNRDGVIIYSPGAATPLMRISASGGTPTPLTSFDPQRGDNTHRYPFFLPDGKHFLFLMRSSGAGAGREPGIFVGSLDGKGLKRVVDVASNPVHASGYLLYAREGALVAQEFDLDRLEVRGEPITIDRNVRMDERFSLGVFSASSNGVLAYQTGDEWMRSRMRWISREGKVLATVGEPAEYFNAGQPSLTPDGKHMLTAIVDVRTGTSDLWQFDTTDGTGSRITVGSADEFTGAWSPDGRRVAFASNSIEGNQITIKTVGSSSVPDIVRSTQRTQTFLDDWSPDGKYLLYTSRPQDGGQDLWAVPVEGSAEAIPIATTAAAEGQPQVSPDSRFLAYVSDESGRDEVYVTGFPAAGPRWQISQNGGTEPRWRPDGGELFFFGPDNRLMAVQVTIRGDDFQVGAITPLFQASSDGANWRYDVLAGGQKFIVNSPLPAEASSPIQLVLNWTAELKK